MAVIYFTLRTAVIAVIIFIVVIVIAIHLLALRHRYAAMCKLHRAPLHSSPFGGNFLREVPLPPCHHTSTAHISCMCIAFFMPHTTAHELSIVHRADDMQHSAYSRNHL